MTPPVSSRQPEAIVHGKTLVHGELSLPYSSVRYAGFEYRLSHAGHHSRKRADSFLSKEPSTLGWIDTFDKDDVYVDVGANVGLYVVYAAVRTGCRVYAFEPEALNYAELNKNLYLNGLNGNDSRVRAFCCGVLGRVGLDTLYLSRFMPAYSHHDCGENRWEGPVTRLAPSADRRPVQGVVTVSLDAAVSGGWIPQPTHVKIDVDGLESSVIAGAAGVLKSDRLQTVLVETDFKLDASLAIMDLMRANGFRYSMDQVCITRGEGKIPPDLWRKRLADREGGCNIIYYRDDKYDKLFADMKY